MISLNNLTWLGSRVNSLICDLCLGKFFTGINLADMPSYSFLAIFSATYLHSVILGIDKFEEPFVLL